MIKVKIRVRLSLYGTEIFYFVICLCLYDIYMKNVRLLSHQIQHLYSRPINAFVEVTIFTLLWSV